jgi:glyoxylase-like metal-dependent hydrolase (beta-lactamase superfamily II)
VTTRVHHLDCASFRPALGRLPVMPERLVSHCLLVEGDDGLTLVDTGFGTGDLAEPKRLGATRTLLGARLDPAEPAVVQVRALGYDPADVRDVVVTHLDLDHAGGLGDFPSAKVHCHAREHAAAMTRRHFKERERYLSAHWTHGPEWELYTEDGDVWRGLPAITRLRGLDADIGLLPMHGHTRGHSAVIVRDRERWLVHAGDAYFHRNAIGTGSVPVGFLAFERATEMNPAQRRGSLAALRRLRESYDDLAMFCAHDPAEYAEMAARSAPPAAEAAS